MVDAASRPRRERRTSVTTGDVVVVTGAAGGIGAATARRLVADGMRVGLVDIDRDGLNALGGELGNSVAVQEADITDLDQMEAATASLVARFGRIDAVVANAATISISSVADTDPADFNHVIQVNVGGIFITAQSALPPLVDSGGYLLFVTSMSGLVQGPFQAAYNASKAAVHAFANTMRQEVSGLGVDVGVIYFNAVDTERARWALSHPVMEPLFSKRTIKPASVDGAAAVVVKAIARRSRTVTYPWKGPLGMYALPVMQRVTDRWVTRQLRP